MLHIRRTGIARCLPVVVISLSAAGGCGSGGGPPGSNPAVGAPLADRALLNARPVALPGTGASKLANSTWRGEASCELTGDIGISINEDSTFSAEIELAFDERGFPVGFFDGDPGAFVFGSGFSGLGFAPIFGIGTGMGGEVPPVPKRADFTPRSFDLAYTRTFAYSMMGVTIEQGELATLEGRLSDSGTQLAGELRVESWTGASYPGEGDETVTTGQRCAFTLYEGR